MAQTVANSWPVSLAQFVSVDAACMLYGLDLVYTPLFFILISPRFQFFLFFFNFFNLIFVYHNLLDSPRRKKVREKNSHQLPECLFSIVPAASLLSSQFSFKTRTTDQSRVLLINSIFLRINLNQNKSNQSKSLNSKNLMNFEFNFSLQLLQSLQLLGFQVYYHVCN